MAEPIRISAGDLKKRLDRGERIVILDSRAPDVWSRSDVKIRGARRFAADDAERHLDEIPRDATIVTYCT